MWRIRQTPGEYRTARLDKWAAWLRRRHLEELLSGCGLLDNHAAQLLEWCRRVGERRNTLADGTIEPRISNVAEPEQVVIPIDEFHQVISRSSGSLLTAVPER
jgi:hypothetical protein